MSKIIKKITSLKKYFVTDNKQLLIRVGIVLLCYSIFMLIDRMTKAFIFTQQEYNSSAEWINWGIIGFRPLTNSGAAFSTFLERYAFLQTIGMLMFLFTIFTTFIKMKFRFFIPLIFIGAGALGNSIDRFIYDGVVRDMLYFPWWPSYATFNFADSFIIVDSIILIIFLIIDLFKTSSTEGTAKFA